MLMSLCASADNTQNGRYTIIISPNVRADTFLLDTQTGRVWKPVQVTDVVGEPVIWKVMDRADSDHQLLEWFKGHQLKKNDTQPQQSEDLSPTDNK